MAKAAKKNPVSMTPDSEPEQAAVEAGVLDGSFSETNLTPVADVQSAIDKVSLDEQIALPSGDVLAKSRSMLSGDAIVDVAVGKVVGQITTTGIDVVAIQVPIERLDRGAGGHVSMKVDVRMTHNQARALKGIYNALHCGGSRRANGQHVDKLSHAVQWLLDQLGV